MADNSTYILLDRNLLSNPRWLRRPFDDERAWIDLILLASYKDHRVPFEGEYNRGVEVKRGDVLTSQVKLAQRWGWSRGKVRRTLDDMETVQRIEQLNTTHYTIIRILNYERYQNIANYLPNNGSDGTTSGTAKRQLEDSKQYTFKEGESKEKKIDTIDAKASEKKISIEEIEKAGRKGDLTPYQAFGLELWEKLGAPTEKKSEFIRIVRDYPEGIVATAFSFAADYPIAEIRYKMFFKKLAELLKK